MMPYLLPQAIERACARWPNQLALIGPQGDALSYAALERRSRAWAAHLQATGCHPGARIGVWLSKSVDAVVALLAVLRAGCIYVPLDPWAPAARIEALAADCSLSALLAGAEIIAAARQWASPPACCWNVAAEAHDLAAGSWRPPVGTSDDVAYILYTSGSTGVPKGVMLSHAHALNFIDWAGEQVGLEPGDRVASHAPFHFDLSIFDLWASLSRGATVCLLDPVTARFPRAVADWIDERRITVWYSVPSALVQMVPLLPQALAASSLRVVLFAGEIFPAPALRAWRAALPQAAFHNWFGPTETNVCTHYALPPAQAAGDTPLPDPLPIGRACPNFELAAWDEAGVPVPAGEAGFLWARGPGILIGYWGDPARTAQVTCVREGPGGVRQRWYNTGDVVRQAASGEFYFLGRRDHLIKCRGYRVSLPEIEHALEALPQVKRAVVIPTPDAAHAIGLHAFVMPAHPASPPRASELLALLGRQLPAYMLPDAIDICACFPETPNGKVDRQQLQRAATPAA